MRLIDIKQHINIAFDKFKYSVESLSGGNLRYKGINDTRVALNSLIEIGIIQKTEDPFELLTATFSDTVIINPSSHPSCEQKMSALKFTINHLYDWINQYVPDTEDESTINIKLPTLNTVEDLINSSDLINKSMRQAISEIGGELKIKHLDYGSSWLIISAGTALAAKLITTLANAAFKIAQKYTGVKMMLSQYERYNMGTEILKQIKEANEKIIAYDARILAEHIEKDFYPESDNERIERLRVSISEMSKLLSLGGEIHPSLIAHQEEVINIPDYKSLINTIKTMTVLPSNTISESNNTESNQQ